jgi:hypothetical protein
VTKAKEPQTIEGEVVKIEKRKAERPKKEKTGTAIATAQTSTPVAAGTAKEISLMAAIARAAADPAVNVDKMVALHNLHREIQADEARRAFDSAFSKMQTELPIISKRGTIEIWSKDATPKLIQSTPFAKWDDIGRVIKPILASHGFALWFKNGREDTNVITTAILTHEGGHREETTVRVPLDTSGSKNNAQGVGSSTSYGKRYAGGSILNLIFEDEDDDAHGTAPTAEERAAARSHTTDTRLGKLADATGGKNDTPERDDDGVIAEAPKPAGKAAGGAKPKKAETQPEGDGQPASDGKNQPKSPDPRPDDADFETFRKYIEDTLPKCRNPADLDFLWKRDVSQWGVGSFLPPDLDELKRMFAARKTELAGG